MTGSKTALLLCLPVILSLSCRNASAALDDLLQCSRDLIYQRKGGSELITLVADLINTSLNPSLSCTKGTPEALCRQLKNNYQGTPSQSIPFYLSQIDRTPATKDIKNLLTGFANPTYNCRSIGFYFGAQIVLVGGTGSFDLALCRSTLGNRWLELRPSGEVTIGPGFAAGGGAMIGWDSQAKYTTSPFSITPRASLDLSNIAAIRIASRGQLIPNAIGIGAEMGAKYAVSGGLQFNITALPFGTDYTYLRTILSGTE
ncbi:hypothetical protein M3P05_16015 [Sansalvadorimonas sp. 2012CJ34-2]|uniref:Uncharacterized protein n=1 Tax=Parendozoicomonas callyspongiae TaxID=2942213 RepID=A0ABT0PJ60_9GAMM|nr:hypothetical protein [Sansalvadorimonas sp. 2012CJ34-2]MCL6271427.1 hypothetical protein [Sansalvadorimonas sp. 2012CJ34-2]